MLYEFFNLELANAASFVRSSGMTYAKVSSDGLVRFYKEDESGKAVPACLIDERRFVEIGLSYVREDLLEDLAAEGIEIDLSDIERDEAKIQRQIRAKSHSQFFYLLKKK